MKIIVAKPKEVPPELINGYKTLLYEHSTIYLGEINRNLRKAKLLSFVIMDDKLVSVRAIKHPPILYLARILNQAKINPLLLPYFLYEVGWSVTTPEYRRKGLSTVLLDCLLCLHKGPIFATNRISNETPQRILKRFGFEQVGKPFMGNKERVIINFKHGGNK